MDKSTLTTEEAAQRLGVTAARVRAMIAAGRLPAEKFGPVYMIKEEDLKLVIDRQTGRPPKAKELILKAAQEVMLEMKVDCSVDRVFQSPDRVDWCIDFSGNYGQICDDFREPGQTFNSEFIKAKIRSYLVKQGKERDSKK